MSSDLGTPGCSTLSPKGKYCCTHHKDRMHLAYDSSGKPPIVAWPFEFIADADDPSVEEGCRDSNSGYVCTHHQYGYHVAGSSRVYKTWLIEEKSSEPSLETTKGCEAASPSGDHYCTHHRDGMHVASDDGYDHIDEIYESWLITQEPGCLAKNPRNTCTCSFHENGNHVARDSHKPDGRVLDAWPLVTESPKTEIEAPSIESLW